MKRVEDLTQARLKEVLEYSPETGKFFRRISTSGCRIGDEAGTSVGRYTKISVDCCVYAAHRLAWLYTYGEWPPDDMDVDHINRDSHDNRISNLRLLTHAQNGHNNNAKGVSYRKSTGRWQAYIGYSYKLVHLGFYDTEEEARNAYLRAKRAVTEEGIDRRGLDDLSRRLRLGG